MSTHVITNRSGTTLGHRVEELCADATEILIASAFVTSDVVAASLLPAVKRGARVRLLTGTYGHFNRKALFALLLKHAAIGKLDVRVWQGDGSHELHAKLFAWRVRRGGEAWIGSANFTNGGFNNEGEITLAERGAWTSPGIARLRAAFESAWRDGTPLDARFVREYREAPRAPPDGRLRAPRAPLGRRARERRDRMLVAYCDSEYDDDSPVVKRIDSVVFPRNTLPWYRSGDALLARARKGDLVLFVERTTRSVCVAELHAVRPDGRSTVATYYTKLVVPNRPWNEQARRQLRRAGLTMAGSIPRGRWLDGAVATRVIAAVRGLPTRR